MSITASYTSQPLPQSSVGSSPAPFLYQSDALYSGFPVVDHVISICFGAYLWGICGNLKTDYKILFETTIRFPTVVYILSRISTLVFLASSVAATVSTNGHVQQCEVLSVLLSAFYVFSVVSTSILFFLRVRAVLHGEKYKVLFFFALWMITFGIYLFRLGILFSDLKIADGLKLSIQPDNCLVSILKLSAGDTTYLYIIITLVCYDTLVFGFICHRIISIQVISRKEAGKMKIFFGLTSLSFISRALLQGSQLYYLISILTNFLPIIFIAIPVSGDFIFSSLVFGITLQNMMACIVYRQLKFGFIARDGVSDVDVHIHTSIRFPTPPEDTTQSVGNSRVSGIRSISTSISNRPVPVTLSNVEESSALEMKAESA